MCSDIYIDQGMKTDRYSASSWSHLICILTKMSNCLRPVCRLRNCVMNENARIFFSIERKNVAHDKMIKYR